MIRLITKVIISQLIQLITDLLTTQPYSGVVVGGSEVRVSGRAFRKSFQDGVRFRG